MLQAKQSKTRFSFMESAKLLKATGEPLRALQDLENSMRLLGLMENKADSEIIDLTEDDEDGKQLKAKVSSLCAVLTRIEFHHQAQVLRARWMNESDRYEINHILRSFQNATDLCPR